MPLTFLLYRCPHCGHDPLPGRRDRAWCPSCGYAFSRGGEGGLVVIEDSSGSRWEVAGHRLASAVEASTAKELEELTSEEALIHRASVKVRQSGEEAPVWMAGELLGFAEAMGDEEVAILELSREALRLRKASGQERSWRLLDIRAVQTSSSSLQFSPASGGLVEFTFPQDSPFRWESLLRESLRRAYRKAGKGEIIEFQPRIVVE